MGSLMLKAENTDGTTPVGYRENLDIQILPYIRQNEASLQYSKHQLGEGLVNPKNILPFIKFRISRWNFLRVKLGQTANVNCDVNSINEDTIVLAVIAFNNPELIRYQHSLIKLNVMDPFFYVVVDNSSDQRSRKEILDYCKDSGVPYIQCPKNPFSVSWSHALVLDWFVRNFVKPKKVRYFGFLDHDIFPIRPTSILSVLRKQPIYGSMSWLPKDSHVWYLWSGFCFYDFQRIPTRSLDFTPGTWRNTDYTITDSGGSNWKGLYSKLNREELVFADNKRVKFRDREDIEESDYLDYHGDWVHTIDGSYWKEIKDKNGKDAYIRRMLDDLVARGRLREGS